MLFIELTSTTDTSTSDLSEYTLAQYKDPSYAAGGCKFIGNGINNGLALGNATSPIYTQLEAVDYCADLEEGGFSDWRLPTQTELYTTAQNLQAYAHFAFNTNQSFWSDTVIMGSGNSIIYSRVNLTSGVFDQTIQYWLDRAVVCVRETAEFSSQSIRTEYDTSETTRSGSR